MCPAPCRIGSSSANARVRAVNEIHRSAETSSYWPKGQQFAIATAIVTLHDCGIVTSRDIEIARGNQCDGLRVHLRAAAAE